MLKFYDREIFEVCYREKMAFIDKIVLNPTIIVIFLEPTCLRFFFHQERFKVVLAEIYVEVLFQMKKSGAKS